MVTATGGGIFKNRFLRGVTLENREHGTKADYAGIASAIPTIQPGLANWINGTFIQNQTENVIGITPASYAGISGTVVVDVAMNGVLNEVSSLVASVSI